MEPTIASPERRSVRPREEHPAHRAAAVALLRSVVGAADPDADRLRTGIEGLPSSLLPLVADHVLRHGAPVEPALRDLLRSAERDAAVASAARAAVVTSIRSALGSAGIEAIFLKGTALAQQVYPKPHTRVMADIDVLVRDGDHGAAVRALEGAGFVTPARRLEESDPRPLARETTLEATVAGAVIMVEMHSSLDAGLPHDISEEMWASRVELGPGGLSVLSLDAQLLHVCLHLARRHGFVGGLSGLVDIAMILRAWSHPAAWDAFCVRTTEAGAAGSVYVALELTRELLAVPVPPTRFDGLRREGVAPVLERARELVWEAEPKMPLGVTRLVGGGAIEPGWVRNRLLLRWQLSKEERRVVASWGRPPTRLVLRYFSRRLGSLAALLLRGELLRPAFWRRAGVERRRRLALRDLAQLERPSRVPLGPAGVRAPV